MDKHAVALALEEIALLLELHGANRFRAGAFRNAARAVERLDADLAGLVGNGGIESVRGIGPATARVITELVEQGSSPMHAELRARTPSGMYQLLKVPGLGPTRIAALREHLGIETIEQLEHAVHAGTLAEVPGFGDRTQDRLAAALAFVRAGSELRRRPQAIEAAQRVTALLAAVPGVHGVEAAGELRRGCETVASLPVVAAADNGAVAAVLRAFEALPGAADTAPVADDGTADGVAADERVRAIRFADGFVVTLHVVAPDAFGTALFDATGSAAHVDAVRARGNADHTSPACATEEALYREHGLDWIAPELREGGLAEIEAAAAGALPDLVAESDLRGCLHCHTTYSDGAATVEELARAAERKGWRYLGIADHSEAASYANGLTPDAVRRQHDEIDAWNDAHGDRVWLFKGVEADILPDGTLDYAARPGLLERFDYVIGSVHGGFRSSGAEMTKRVLRALDDPRLTVLGHPTGRLLLTRDAYELDVPRVLARAGERGVIIEINADPRRLELDWRWWPEARTHGVRCAINPDAHSVAGLDNVTHGVAIARKGWLAAEQVLTTWPLETVREYFAARRRAWLG